MSADLQAMVESNNSGNSCYQSHCAVGICIHCPSILPRWELSYPFYRGGKQGSGKLTHLPRVKQLLSRFMSAWGWRWSLGKNQREELLRWGLGGTRHLSCGKLDPNVRPHLPTPNKRPCTLRRTICSCFSLVLPFVESLLTFSRAVWMSIGCFSNNKCFFSSRLHD